MINKKFVLVNILFFGLLFGFASFAHAEVIISEVMYGPSSGASHEWLEISNTGSEAVDLTNWRFFNSSETSSPLRLQRGDSTQMGPQTYAIITNTNNVGNFLSDYPDFSGLIFTSSSFSLPDESSKYNTYKAISDSEKTVMSSVTYDTSIGGSKDSGNSLQYASGSWIPALPTPGTTNKSEPAEEETEVEDDNNEENTSTMGDTTNNSSNTSNSNTSTSSVLKSSSTPKEVKKIIPKKIATNIVADSKVVAGIPVRFSFVTTGYIGEALLLGRWIWNFGDGTSKENINNVEPFTHTYIYPGDYAVSLEYYDSLLDEESDAQDHMIVTVIRSSVVISNVDYKEGTIELSNSTGMNMNIGGWTLSAGNTTYVFPKNTTILSGKKLQLSGRGFGLYVKEGEPVFLLFPDKSAVSTFPIIKSPTENVAVPVVAKKSSKKKASKKVTSLSDSTNNETVNIASLAVAAAASPLLPTQNNKANNSYVWFLGGVVIFGGVGAVSFRRYVRKKNKTEVEKEADGYEILE